jgi:hypothetical protein
MHRARKWLARKNQCAVKSRESPVGERNKPTREIFAYAGSKKHRVDSACVLLGAEGATRLVAGAEAQESAIPCGQALKERQSGR